MAVVKSNCIIEDIIFMAGRDVYADKLPPNFFREVMERLFF